MSGKYDIYPEFQNMIQLEMETEEATLALFRQINEMSVSLLESNKSDDKIKITKEKIKSYDGEEIGIQIFQPQEIKADAPCLIYYHGGGFMGKTFEHHVRLIRKYTLKVDCKVVLVDYRISLDYPFPAGLEDCYAALNWVYDNAESLDIDTNKIAVGGDSAGGNFSAAISQMARDRNGPFICFQMLIYPVADVRETESMKQFDDTPVWNSNLNKLMWKVYLRNGDMGMRQYVSPIEAKSLKDLPPAYVEVNEFDPLRDEGIAYANALSENGVKVNFIQLKGTVHGYDIVAESSVTKESVERRVAVLKEAFN